LLEHDISVSSTKLAKISDYSSTASFRILAYQD